MTFWFACYAKALPLFVIFFSFSFKSVFLGGLAKVFYFFMLLLKTHATSIGLISLNTLEKKNFARDAPLVAIAGTCGSRHVMCFRLFTVTSIHNIRKRTRNRNLETRLKVIEDLNLKRQRINLISQSSEERE